MQNYLEETNKLKLALPRADALIIGAGAGLSASGGYDYGGKRFRENFSDFELKYGFHDMYSGGFYPFPTLEEYWAYWSRFILINRYIDPPKPIYQMLLRLIKDKDYFVVTTNVDHCFQRANFDKSRLFYTQGDYGLFQCSVPCHEATYDNEKTVRRMVECQNNMQIPSELIPRCPRCAKPMTMNLRSDDKFVEDAGWHAACKRYQDFISKHKNSNLCLLELGVGWNTPSIIKYPFWRLAAENPKTVYAAINLGEAVCPDSIKDGAILIDGDIFDVLSNLVQA